MVAPKLFILNTTEIVLGCYCLTALWPCLALFIWQVDIDKYW